MTKDTQATLIDDMVAQVLGRKGAPAPSTVTTPTPTTSPKPPRVRIPAVFPNDAPLDAIRAEITAIGGLCAEIVQRLGWLQTTTDAWEAALSGSPAMDAPGATAPLEVASESIPPPDEAQAAFDAALAAKQAAAQEAVSTKWKCPEHGIAELRTNSRTGRQYRVCGNPECDEIERVRV
jgi:hypothetical protein